MSEIMTNFRAVDMPGAVKSAPKAVKPVATPAPVAAPAPVVVVAEPIAEEVLEVSVEESVEFEAVATEDSHLAE